MRGDALLLLLLRGGASGGKPIWDATSPFSIASFRTGGAKEEEEEEGDHEEGLVFPNVL